MKDSSIAPALRNGRGPTPTGVRRPRGGPLVLDLAYLPRLPMGSAPAYPRYTRDLWSCECRHAVFIRAATNLRKATLSRSIWRVRVHLTFNMSLLSQNRRPNSMIATFPLIRRPPTLNFAHSENRGGRCRTPPHLGPLHGESRSGAATAVPTGARHGPRLGEASLR